MGFFSLIKEKKEKVKQTDISLLVMPLNGLFSKYNFKNIKIF